MGNRQSHSSPQKSLRRGAADVEMGFDESETEELERLQRNLEVRRKKMVYLDELRKLQNHIRTQSNIQARRSAYAKSASEPVSCVYSIFCSCWTMGHSFSWVVQDIIDGIQLTEDAKLQLWEYYVKMVEDYDAQARRAGWWLVHLQMLRTTFNIILPAILALQNLGSLSIIIMWLTWGLSLAVSLATGYIDLFKLRERFEMMTRATEYLKLEGWQFFGLIGRYSNFVSHSLALNLFLYRVAKIRKRIIDMEFPPSSKNVSNEESKRISQSPEVPNNAPANLFVGPRYLSEEEEDDDGEDDEENSNKEIAHAFRKRVVARRPAPAPRTAHYTTPHATPYATPHATPHAAPYATPLRSPSAPPKQQTSKTPGLIEAASKDTDDEVSDDETVRM